MTDQIFNPYPPVPSAPNLPNIEMEILDFWDKDETFAASVEMRPAKTAEGSPNEYVFYDGPPFANGLPHYGHILTGFIKDALPRYQTMRGKRVERRFGWDCHGLPAEMAAESELGVSGRIAITEFGIDKFNAHCRSLVLRTTDTWERYVRRQARWVDMENDYKTMNTDYMESVIWAFKQLWEKDLAYEGYRVLPYCWECETPLSNFETRQDDSYRQRVDPSVTVRFKLDSASPFDQESSLMALVWTTTPWTLPSNLALAVGPDINYSVIKDPKNAFVHLVIAKERVEAYRTYLSQEDSEDQSESSTIEVVGELKGSDLVGKTYTPIFPYFKETENAFTVLSAAFVTTEDGTGIVHLAPGFGEDDQAVCAQSGIGVVCPIDDRARFTNEVSDFVGLQVFEANSKVIEILNESGQLFEHHDYEHSYPHCWRSDTPLVYKAVSSWFIAVTKIKDRMLELNKEIRWIPEHVRDGAFGKWLEGARDWSISRNRFWGTPIPVWKSSDDNYPRIDVYGSIEELESDFGVKVSDLHRPEIDELTRPNPDDPTGKSMMMRIPDVLDCWFESGAMPFAQLHYPFENGDWFNSHFPADFIVEYIGQVRGWFYTLHVLGTALFDKHPFDTCLTHGVILGDDGRKLSKRLKNYPDPEEVFASAGADAMRWFLLAGPACKGLDVAIDAKGPIEAIRQVLHPFWNAWHFLSLYGNVDSMRGELNFEQVDVLDAYILAKAADVARKVTSSLDKEDLPSAAASIYGFLDALTNWYIRRSRDRFWAPNGDPVLAESKQAAYDTLHSVLYLMCKVSAPLLPLLSESIYKGLTGDRSVHLTDWPDIENLPDNPELVASMDLVRQVCSLGHSIRKANNLRARLPLASLTIASKSANDLEPFVELIKDELNVKEVRLAHDMGPFATLKLNVVPGVLGPRLGAMTQEVLRAVKAENWTKTKEGKIEVLGVELEDEEATLILVPKDQVSARVLENEDGIITLDLNLTTELEAEGAARDLIRIIQNARKDANYVVTDRIEISIRSNRNVLDQVTPHLVNIANSVLCDSEISITEDTSIDLKANMSDPFLVDTQLPNGDRVEIVIAKS
ncbi:MAG: isoleucine--tRNA ligase [Acidimicrobiales bacterium]|nr:isoleucine--tRNA ligase [Acidimicrobiales bacterium]